MRQLNNILYVTTPDLYLSLDGENIVVSNKQVELKRVPLHNLEGIITFGYSGASPALMGKCAKDGIALTFMTRHGRFLARVCGEQHGNVLLRKEQYRVSDDSTRSLQIAKNMMLGKFYNSRIVIERAIRDHKLQIDVQKLEKASLFIRQSYENVIACQYMNELLGIEGKVADIYFNAFDDLILQQKSEFKFINRNRRPPTDKLNALLSFFYTLLAHDCAAALESVGLDAYVGFYHQDRPGRLSLALDLMEELRSIMVDRFVLSLVNKKIVKSDDFLQRENGAIVLKDEGRRNVIESWQNRKNDTIKHPFLKETISWGLVPFAQAQLLARFLRGDLQEYPPFFWK